MDFGLLLIRAVVGLILAAHGAQKLFGWFGGYGIAGVGEFLESLGFRPGRRAAEMAGTAEVVGGALLVLGLLTPLGAAAVIGVMVVAGASVHRGRGFAVTSGGWEFVTVLGVVAAGLAFTGPGAISLDRALDLDLGGPLWGVLAVAIGLAAAGTQLSVRRVDDPGIDLRDEVVDATDADTAPYDIEADADR
ncbi:MAG TPA: DoxX family protein [Acidimicrobiales bacterium]